MTSTAPMPTDLDISPATGPKRLSQRFGPFPSPAISPSANLV